MSQSLENEKSAKKSLKHTKAYKLPKLKKLKKRTIKRLVFAVVVLALVGLLVFAEIIHPNREAVAYNGRIEKASAPLQTCFQKVADSTQQDLFYSADVDIKVKQDDVKDIQTVVAECRTAMQTFRKTVDSLLSLPLSGYTKEYRHAQLTQQHAENVLSQSNDILNQYNAMADFLSQYYAHLSNFLAAYDSLEASEQNYTISNRNQFLSKLGSSMHTEAAALRALKAPVGFTQVRDSAATMTDQLANGFDNLAKGFDSYSDYYKSQGYQQVDAAIKTYDKSVIGQPFPVIHDSYLVDQVNSLPSKVENILAAESE